MTAMDAETKDAWDRYVDSRIRQLLHSDEVLGAISKAITHATCDAEDRMAAKFEKRIGELETELKVLRSELAVSKTLNDIDERLARMANARPGLRVA